ncbi:uncharacterized protein TNCV_2385261 [Trichonephila clavipes]|nr:uncharacterized protein TNCV_2385261 [Trichonephila clavipes]
MLRCPKNTAKGFLVRLFLKNHQLSTGSGKELVGSTMMDSDEDIRLSETDYEESEEKTDIIDYIPVNPVTYIARDSTEWIPNNSNVPGRFAIRNVLRQSSGPTSFVKLSVSYDIKGHKI